MAADGFCLGWRCGWIASLACGCFLKQNYSDAIAEYTYSEVVAFGDSSGFLRRRMAKRPSNMPDPSYSNPHGDSSYSAYALEISDNSDEDVIYRGVARSPKATKIASYAMSWKEGQKPLRRCEALFRYSVPARVATTMWEEVHPIIEQFDPNNNVDICPTMEEKARDSAGFLNGLTLEELFKPSVHPAPPPPAAADPGADGPAPMEVDEAAAAPPAVALQPLPPGPAVNALSGFMAKDGVEYVPLVIEILFKVFPPHLIPTGNARRAKVQSMLRHAIVEKYNIASSKRPRSEEDWPLGWDPATQECLEDDPQIKAARAYFQLDFDYKRKVPYYKKSRVQQLLEEYAERR
jgi:hypothetical protein